MSSGLPPILTATQSAGANGFSFNNGFAPFGYLFPGLQQGISNQQNASNSAVLNRFKVKRHRQRVDAGEPRNTYQGTSSSTSSNTSTSSTTSLPIATSSSPTNFVQKTEEEEEETMTLADETETATTEQQENQIQNQQEVQKEDVVGEEEYEAEETDEVADEVEDFEGREESPGSNSSSASKRKSFMPQKIGEQLGIEIGEEPEQINVTVGASNEESEDVAEDNEPTEKLSALQSQLQNGSLAETQRRIYMTFLEQQRKQMNAGAAQIAPQNKVNYDQLLAKIQHEMQTGFMKAMDKIIREWAAEQEVVQTPAPPAPFHPIFPPNPLFHLQNAHPMTAGGIFPANFNPFNAFNALRRNLQDTSSESETKKKRARMEVKKEDVVSNRASPLSASASPPLGSSTPLSRFFPPPTMVGHPYGSMNFCGEREDSPTNSDELSDCGFEGNGSSSMLTPMHLRKAKLMFFYTRYPNSNLLKSYFPDIRFNKANTAQLVKWFSNFREFYYIQMEKFGRQLLAEGVRDRSEIFVTKNSELFKVLNTHYNRNNHIEPPENLVRVVQETLREFYDAIKLGKDVEPSWKKTIYKVINRMDDPIPDRFKDPNFLGSLE